MLFSRYFAHKWREMTYGLLAGQSYDAYKQRYFTLKTVKLPRTRLSKDLERLCGEKGGFLTMEEYYQEELYGSHGFYATSYQMVLTNTPPRWAQAMLTLCKLYDYHFFAELGPGDGRLALMTLDEAKKVKYPLDWGGVEIAQPMRREIERGFQRQHYTDHKKFLVSTIDQMKIDEKCFFIFPYGLDSISPEVFVNAGDKKGVPTTLLGVKITNGVLSEVVLTKKELASRGITITEGIYKTKDIAIDLTSWKLLPMQRAYIAPKVLSSVIEVVKRIPEGSRLCVIDEFRTDKGGYISTHLLAPRNLIATDRDCVDIPDGYERIGTIDYYFPFYLKSFLGFLTSVGIETEFVESEYFAADVITKMKMIPPRVSFPTAYSQVVITKPLTGNKKKLGTVSFPLDPADLRSRT